MFTQALHHNERDKKIWYEHMMVVCARYDFFKILGADTKTNEKTVVVYNLQKQLSQDDNMQNVCLDRFKIL